jgi:hypothetical protein
MQVAEILGFEDYYSDSCFEKKKPAVNGNAYEQCGDNMYFKSLKGEWKQHPSLHHRDPQQRAKDLKHPFVFIAKHFYYFGDHAVEIPTMFKTLIWNRQGCKCQHDTAIVSGFLKWLQENFKAGINGLPFDWEASPFVSLDSIAIS